MLSKNKLVFFAQKMQNAKMVKNILKSVLKRKNLSFLSSLSIFKSSKLHGSKKFFVVFIVDITVVTGYLRKSGTVTLLLDNN